MTQPDLRLFTVCVPGLDIRQISAAVTPFLHGLFAKYPSVRLRGQPTPSAFSSLVTGTNPGEHQIWHVSLKSEVEDPWTDVLLDRLPDFLVTTYQCARHFLNPLWGLPAIPRRRRRRFNIHRPTKSTLRHESSVERLGRIGGVPSLFGLLGDECNYCGVSDFKRLLSRRAELPDGQYKLQFFEINAFDWLSHWGLDQPQLIHKHLRIVDDSLRELHQRCEQRGATMLLVLPNGQEKVTNHINITKLLKATGVPASEYDYFVAVAIARLWFSTERARRVITEALQKHPKINLRTNGQLRQYNIELDGDRWGQLYAIADHGSIFFPHDFYHPLGNFYMGLTTREQRPRIFNPRHRGYHGYLPDHPAERGAVLLADQKFTACKPEIDFIDFAPTVLELLGRDKPEFMRGQTAFKPLAVSQAQN